MRQFIVHNPVKLAFTWAFIIFLLCGTPGEYIPSADWMELLSIDKLVHASLFFILSALGLGGLVKSNKTRFYFVLLFIATVLYGIFLEWMQAKFFSNRSADWKDVVANTLGCLIAVLLLKKIKRYFTAFA